MTEYEKARYAYFEKQWNVWRGIVDSIAFSPAHAMWEKDVKQCYLDAQQKAQFCADVLDMLHKAKGEVDDE